MTLRQLKYAIEQLPEADLDTPLALRCPQLGSEEHAEEFACSFFLISKRGGPPHYSTYPRTAYLSAGDDKWAEEVCSSFDYTQPKLTP